MNQQPPSESGRAARLLAAVSIALSAAFLLAGYEFLRSASQSLYIGAYGAKNLPVAMALAPVGTLLFIWGYGWLLSVAGAARATVLTCLAAAAAMVACHAAMTAGSRLAVGLLYVLRESYIVLLVEQIWAFINSTLREREGRRLNGPICGVASLGAIGGGLAVQAWVRSVGSVNLVLFGALSLLPTALGAMAAYRAAGEPEPAPDEAHGRQGHLGLRVLWRDPLLRVLALVVIASQVVSTVFDLQLSRFVETALPVADERTRWFGSFYVGLNVGSALFLFVVAPLLLAVAPLRLVHTVIPLTHVTLAVTALVCPSLRSAAAALAVFKVLDYSVFRAAKELLYVPLSFDARYRAKALIDAFGYRFAKGGASAILAVAGRVAAIPVAALAAVAALASGVWLALVPGLRRRPHAGSGHG